MYGVGIDWTCLIYVFDCMGVYIVGVLVGGLIHGFDNDFVIALGLVMIPALALFNQSHLNPAQSKAR